MNRHKIGADNTKQFLAIVLSWAMLCGALHPTRSLADSQPAPNPQSEESPPIAQNGAGDFIMDGVVYEALDSNGNSTFAPLIISGADSEGTPTEQSTAFLGDGGSIGYDADPDTVVTLHTPQQPGPAPSPAPDPTTPPSTPSGPSAPAPAPGEEPAPYMSPLLPPSHPSTPAPSPQPATPQPSSRPGSVDPGGAAAGVLAALTNDLWDKLWSAFHGYVSDNLDNLPNGRSARGTYSPTPPANVAPRDYPFQTPVDTPTGQQLAQAWQYEKAVKNSIKPTSPQAGQQSQLTSVADASFREADNDFGNGNSQTAQIAMQIGMAALDVAISLTPAGVGRDMYEAVTGKGLLSGRQLDGVARGLAILNVSIFVGITVATGGTGALGAAVGCEVFSKILTAAKVIEGTDEGIAAAAKVIQVAEAAVADAKAAGRAIDTEQKLLSDSERVMQMAEKIGVTGETKIITTTEAQATLPAGYTQAYKDGVIVVNGTIDSSASTETLVRFFPEGSETTGMWATPASEVEGMTASQIQEHLGLPELPANYSTVKPQAGLQVNVGVAAPQPTFNGAPQGGGMQTQFIGRADGWGDPAKIGAFFNLPK